MNVTHISQQDQAKPLVDIPVGIPFVTNDGNSYMRTLNPSEGKYYVVRLITGFVESQEIWLNRKLTIKLVFTTHELRLG